MHEGIIDDGAGGAVPAGRLPAVRVSAAQQLRPERRPNEMSAVAWRRELELQREEMVAVAGHA